MRPHTARFRQMLALMSPPVAQSLSLACGHGQSREVMWEVAHGYCATANPNFSDWLCRGRRLEPLARMCPLLGGVHNWEKPPGLTVVEGAELITQHARDVATVAPEGVARSVAASVTNLPA